MRNKLAILVFFACASTLHAQRGPRAQQPGQTPPTAGDSTAPRPNRVALEQQVQQRMAQVTKDRLGATDQQMEKLQAVNRKYDEKRRLIVDQERDIRMSLRDEMLRPDSARQPQVAALLDRVIKTQRQRVDLQEQEQKELSGFLSPLQRAKYFALEQQIRQRVNQMRQAQLPGRGGRGRGPGQPSKARGRGVQPPPPPQ